MAAKMVTTEEIIDSLVECPICAEERPKKFLGCRNGHIWCEPCGSKLYNCPFCRSTDVRCRNLIAERLIEGDFILKRDFENEFMPIKAVEKEFIAKSALEAEFISKHELLQDFIQDLQCHSCKDVPGIDLFERPAA